MNHNSLVKETRMELSDSNVKKIIWNAGQKGFLADCNTLLGEYDISMFGTCLNAKDCWISPGSWQSWNPGFEIAPGKKQDKLTCRVIPQWNAYLQVPGHKFSSSRNSVLCQFVSYLRKDNKFFLIASTGLCSDDGSAKNLPPVYYFINRKKNNISVFVCDKGKEWAADEKIAEVVFCEFNSWFDAKDFLSSLYNPARFNRLNFLGKNPGGWESWYNHYADIDENQIIDDLNSLCSTKNIISSGYLDKKLPAVFQIDDGWEKGLGIWEFNKKFPSEPKSLTEKIEEKKLIPGLWIAPFIADIRQPLFKEHPEWILHDENGKPIEAGYNPLWGKHGTFYALDLSNDNVLLHLDNIINKAINQWGFRYLKLDFLYAGMLYGKFSQGGSAFQWYNRAVSKLTSRKETSDGKPVAYLGCGAPLEQSFNYFPLCRIGCDTYEHWENKISRMLGWNGRNSAYLNLKDTLGHAMWNRSIFFCDPDVIFIRKDNCSLSENEKELIAFIAFAFGSQTMYSDNPVSSSGTAEKQMTEKILELKSRFEDEEFSAVTLKKDVFEFISRTGKIKGKIDLKKRKLFIGE